MHKLIKRALLLTSLVFAFSVSSCVEKHASEDEIAEYIENNIPESVTLVDKSTSENKKDVVYCYESDIRNLSFEAWSSSDAIYVDGTFFGHTGKYNIATNYLDACYSYYNDTMLELLKQHDFLQEEETFENLRHSNTFDYCKSFIFVLDNSTYDYDYRYVDAFLNDVRTKIIQKEYEITGQELEFSYEIYLKIDDNYYQRTAGTEAYDVKIHKDIEIHVHDDVKPHNMMQANVIPPVYNGLLIDLCKGDSEK